MGVWQEEGSWPNLSTVAQLLGVSKATLSKQAQGGRVAFVVLGLGRGTHVVPPREVLRLGQAYRRVPPAILKQRLAAWAARQSQVPADILLRELDQIEDTEAVVQDRGEDMTALAPAWMTNVDHLLAHPDLLTGTLILAVPDELGGQAVLGQHNLDEQATRVHQDDGVLAASSSAPLAPTPAASGTHNPAAE